VQEITRRHESDMPYHTVAASSLGRYELIRGMQSTIFISFIGLRSRAIVFRILHDDGYHPI